MYTEHEEMPCVSMRKVPGTQIFVNDRLVFVIEGAIYAHAFYEAFSQEVRALPQVKQLIENHNKSGDSSLNIRDWIDVYPVCNMELVITWERDLLNQSVQFHELAIIVPLSDQDMPRKIYEILEQHHPKGYCFGFDDGYDGFYQFHWEEEETEAQTDKLPSIPVLEA